MINVKRTKLDMFSSDMNGAVTAVVSWRVGGLGYRSVRHLNTTHLKLFPYRSSIAICKHINKKGVIIFDQTMKLPLNLHRPLNVLETEAFCTFLLGKLLLVVLCIDGALLPGWITLQFCVCCLQHSRSVVGPI